MKNKTVKKTKKPKKTKQQKNQEVIESFLSFCSGRTAQGKIERAKLLKLYLENEPCGNRGFENSYLKRNNFLVTQMAKIWNNHK